jgi:hypothetical protein
MRALLIVTLLVLPSFAAAPLPRPLPEHPGNIFEAGERVVVPVDVPGDWTMTDYDGTSTSVAARDGKVDLGERGIGYYELRHAGRPGRITIGVIAPLTAPTPATSPISIDVAMAWFYGEPATRRAVANLCNLAGVNWVRDRLSWPEMEPARGQVAGHNRYDDTADVQTAAGLKVLQVNHASPPWASSSGSRFPTDLRDAYNVYKATAARWKGKVLAFEPWNEADIQVFGGHTGSEMATLQKAAYFGLKAGNPDVIACQNVFAISRQSTLDDFAANDATACFDTYNIHHYVGFDQYDAYYARHRAVSGGKPMWVTECSVTVNWADEKTKEPDRQSLRWQANRVAKVYASSLYLGSVNTFYFILGHYVERTVQYGLIHEDLTPRPGFVALAAVGRLLADAKPVGRVKSDDPKIRAYLFRARPDGQEKFVLVAWRNGDGHGELKLDAPVEQAFDHFGREHRGASRGPITLNAVPAFLVMSADPSAKLPLEPPPAPPAPVDDKPCPVVLQALPESACKLDQSAFSIPSQKPTKVPLYAYNFAGKSARGELRVTAPAGWEVAVSPAAVDVKPGDRKPLELTVHPQAAAAGEAGTVRVDADFGDAGKQVLSFRLIPE